MFHPCKTNGLSSYASPKKALMKSLMAKMEVKEIPFDLVL